MTLVVGENKLHNAEHVFADLDDNQILRIGEFFKFTQKANSKRVLSSPRFIISRLKSFNFVSIMDNVHDGKIVSFSSDFKITQTDNLRHSQSLDNKAAPKLTKNNYITELRYVCTCEANNDFRANRQEERPVCTIRTNDLRGSICHQETSLWNLEDGFFCDVNTDYEGRINDTVTVDFTEHSGYIVRVGPINKRRQLSPLFTYSFSSRNEAGVSINPSHQLCVVKMKPNDLDTKIVGYDKDGIAYKSPKQCHCTPKKILVNGAVVKNTIGHICGGKLMSTFSPELGMVTFHATEQNLRILDRRNQPYTDIINVVSGVNE